MTQRRRPHQRKLSSFGTKLVLIVTFATLLGMSGLASAHHNPNHGQGPPDSSPGDAEITVEWHLDNMGANVTSSKEISNVIVEFCPDPETGERFGKKYDNLSGNEFTFSENETVIAIWVKSGDNYNPNDPRPPEEFDRGQSAGEYFENENAVCPGDPDPHPEPECHPHVSGSAEEGPMNHITWTELDEAVSYNVYRAVGDGPWQLVATVDADTHEYEDTNVTEGTTYSYQVTATLETQEETEPCNKVILTAIPVFPTLLAAGAAGVLGLGAYAVTQRRN